MWRPDAFRKQAAVFFVVFAPLTALLACPTRPLSVPPGAALAPPERERQAELSPPKTRAIRRVDTCDVPPVPLEDSGTFSVDYDITYGSAPRQTLDIAWPAVAAKGVVVIVHGGGWTSGSKKLFHSTIRLLANLGYVAATTNYRLASSAATSFPVNLGDVRCAIREVLARAEAKQIDGSKLVVLGASAGGHLAAMIGVDGDNVSEDDGCERKGPIHVKGIIAYYAPLEIDRARDHYPRIMNAAVDELFRMDAGSMDAAAVWETRAFAATPSHFVDRDDAPMLFIHGTSDRIVPFGDSRALAAALESVGVPSLVVEVPGEDHGFAVFGKQTWLRPATCTALAFLNDVLK